MVRERREREVIGNESTERDGEREGEEGDKRSTLMKKEGDGGKREGMEDVAVGERSDEDDGKREGMMGRRRGWMEMGCDGEERDLRKAAPGSVWKMKGEKKGKTREGDEGRKRIE